LGIRVSDAALSPVPPVEPSISSVRPDTGSQTPVSRTTELPNPAREPTPQKTRRKIRKNRGVGKPAGRINLDTMEDRAWLGALIVGDGSIYAKGDKNIHGKKFLRPVVSAIMCDKYAIQKAARLTGVMRTSSGNAPITGRKLWRMLAIGGRALEVLNFVRPFLTGTRIKQAARVVKKARASGFRTRHERKEQHKLGILTLVKLEPGSSTKRIQRGTRLDIAYARRYLNELAEEGKIRNAPKRARSQIRNRWFPVAKESSIQALQEKVASSRQSEAIASSYMVNWSRTTSMPSGRGCEPRLGNPLDQAWLGGLMVGEGTIVTFRPKVSSHDIPRIAIRMLDNDAIRRAAVLMAVACVRSGKSKRSGRQFWQANAVGDRAIGILETIRPYLTLPKLAQAHRAITKARKSGFRTMREMQAARKEVTLQYVQGNPGSLTTEIVQGARVVNKAARKYLGELESEGKIRKVVGGTPRKPNSRWYPIEDSLNG
jgi:predicted transcriptional regulator